MVEFTTNIKLADGNFTGPQGREPEDNKPIFLTAARYFRMFYRDSLPSKTLVDLGCLEGAHTLGFARLGFDALGIEVRNENFACCQFVKEATRLPNLRYAQDNAWNVAKYGAFDAVFCSGLLYHLDRPLEFIKILGSVCREMLILNTHFAPEHEDDPQLSPMTEHDGARGRWFAEPLARSVTARDEQRWSSWDNRQSFWLAKPDLLQAMADAGFALVIEAFDFLAPDIRGSMLDGYYHDCHRNMFVAIREPAARAPPISS